MKHKNKSKDKSLKKWIQGLTEVRGQALRNKHEAQKKQEDKTKVSTILKKKRVISRIVAGSF